MKLLKWLGIVVAGILVLLALAIGVVSATFDPNKYKGDITQYVKENQQRTLVIPGNLSLSFFPKLGVQVGELTLSEFKSDKTFVWLAGAKVFVELLPLLSRQVVVDSVRIDGLAASVVKGKNGKFNFDDLLAKDPVKPEAKPASSGQDRGQALSFDIDGVKISDASISYRDETDGTQISLTQLNAQTGRIAANTPSSFDLSAKVESTKPRASLSAAVKAGVTMDLEARKFAFTNLGAKLSGSAQGGVDNASAKFDAATLDIDVTGGQIELDKLAFSASGKQGGAPFEISVEAPRLKVSQSAASGDAITGSVKLSGQQDLEVKFKLSGVSGHTKSLAISSIRLDYKARNADSSSVGSLSSALSANLETQVFEFKQIDANLKIDNPNIPAKTVTLPIRGSARADLGRGTVVADISTRFDESSIQAKVGLSKLAPPAYTFDVVIDKLNADRYRVAGSAAGAPAATPGAERPIDLSALRGLNATGQLRVGALQANQVKLSNVALTFSAAGGKAQLAPLTAGLYGGTMSAVASIDANNNGYQLKNTFANVSIHPLLKDAANQDILEGKGHIVVDLASNGTLPSALKKVLRGNVSVKLTDGAIKGINIAERIRNAKTMLAGKAGAQGANRNEKTDFSELSLSAVIANGVANSHDLNMASPLLRAKGAGKVDIGANTLDYTVRPKLVATSKGQEGKSYEQLSGIEMPVRIFGPLDAPQYQPDYAAAALSAAQSEIGGKLLEKAGAGKAAGLLGAITGKDTAKPAAPAAAGTAPAPAPAEPKKKPADLIKGLFK